MASLSLHTRFALALLLIAVVFQTCFIVKEQRTLLPTLSPPDSYNGGPPKAVWSRSNPQPHPNPSAVPVRCGLEQAVVRRGQQ